MPVPRMLRRLAVFAAGVAGVVAFAAGPAAATTAHTPQLHCAEAPALNAHLPGDHKTYKVRGELCYTGSPEGKPLQVAVSGFSYTRWYWDPTYQQDTYSYARSAARAGFAVYVPDQLGSGGASSVPPAAEVSILNQTDVLHQLIGQLREGKVAHTKFHKIVAVGHSLGAQEVLLLASNPRYAGDVQGVIAADYLHAANPAGVTAVRAQQVPAVQTNKFRHAPWAAGYLSTADDQRSIFYDTDYADAGMIAADEKHKGVASTATAAQVNYLRDNPTLTNNITVPVLVAVGKYDSLGCGAPADGLSCGNSTALALREKPFYGGACLNTFVLPNAGHDINLHRSAPGWFTVANAWSQNMVANPLPDPSCL